MPPQDIAINHNGTLLATVSNDKTAKVFDVVNFDMINIIKLGEWDVECS
jgi:peptidylprolyl isomerase domain and WD repeat-containing protein 1